MRKISYNFYQMVAWSNGFMKRGKYAYRILSFNGKLYRCPIAWLNTCVEDWEEMEVEGKGMKRFIVITYNSEANTVNMNFYEGADISAVCALAVIKCASYKLCLLSVKEIPEQVSDVELTEFLQNEKKRVKELMNTAIAQED